uniref:Uncharacterized protein n=1 Tax=Rhizophora mucronata TaxID=61149 RepID=A0A2P2PT50_RHIMU
MSSPILSPNICRKLSRPKNSGTW